ncbi:MAG: hypothetical protein LUE86_12840 [Clostridiales bacterium]|nr:hypothetical protein [Clostridiales bacterium]
MATILLWTHAKMLLCGERKADLKKILTNVNILAILVGGGLMLMRLKLPAILAGTMKSVSVMIGPISMIITGMIVGSIRPQQLKRYRRLWLIVALRLIVIPAIILLLLKYSGAQTLVRDGQTIMLISLLAVMTPPASTITQMAQVYGQDAEYSSAINVVATISCIITMPLLVALYLH